MGKPAAVSQSEIDKAVKVAVQHGLEVREIVIEPGRAQIRDALTASGIERDQYLGPDGHVLTRRDMRELFGVK